MTAEMKTPALESAGVFTFEVAAQVPQTGAQSVLPLAAAAAKTLSTDWSATP